jgi:hypothetical protein
VAATLPGLAWAGAIAALWLGQEQLLFRPAPLAADTRLSDEPDVHERFVDLPGAISWPRALRSMPRAGPARTCRRGR